MGWTFPNKEISKHSTQVAASRAVQSKIQIGGHRPKPVVLTPVIDPEHSLSAAEVTDLANQLLRGITKAVSMWCSMARFQNITIHGPVANAGPGCLTGIPLGVALRNQPEFLQTHAMKRSIADAVLLSVSECFEVWQSYVTVPAILWYPNFAAVPAPVAPPTPNLPTTLQVCVSAYQFKLTSSSEIKTAINQHLPEELRSQLAVFSKKMAESLSSAFNLWLSVSVVTNVMGTGTVPAFRPPAVPSGPVVGGYTVPTPSNLANAAPLIMMPVSQITSGAVLGASV